MRKDLINSVKAVIKEEEEAAIKKFPLFNSTHEGYAVIAEEFDEAKEAIEMVKLQLDTLWNNVKKNNFENRAHSLVEVGYLESAAVNLACEAVQIAAMANKFIDSLNKSRERK